MFSATLACAASVAASRLYLGFLPAIHAQQNRRNLTSKLQPS